MSRNGNRETNGRSGQKVKSRQKKGMSEKHTSAQISRRFVGRVFKDVPLNWWERLVVHAFARTLVGVWIKVYFSGVRHGRKMFREDARRLIERYMRAISESRNGEVPDTLRRKILEFFGVKDTGSALRDALLDEEEYRDDAEGF